LRLKPPIDASYHCITCSINGLGDEGDVSELKNYLVPLLDKYNVHAYICGHDHVGEHLVHPDHSTQFFVVGAGTMITSYAKSSSEATALYFGAGYASFGVMTATPHSLKTEWVDIYGVVRYDFTLTNPMTTDPTSRPTVYPSQFPTTVPPSIAPSAPNGLIGQMNSTDSNNPRSNVLHEFIQSNSGKYVIASGGLLILVCALLMYSALGRSRNPNHFTLPTEDIAPKHPKLQALRAKQKQLKQYMELLEQGEIDKFNEAHQSDGYKDTSRERPEYIATMHTTAFSTESHPDEVACAADTSSLPTHSAHQRVNSMVYNKIRDEDESSQRSSRVRSRGSTMAI